MNPLLERFGSPWLPPETISVLRINQNPLATCVLVAERGRFAARPNPVVGATMGQGVGWHEAYGHAHAERNLLSSATAFNGDNCMYVSLEPCAHAGKQPPCTDLLLNSGISKVVWAVNDSNPETACRARQILESAGTTCDEEPDEQIKEIASRQNIGFHLWNTEGRPAVHGKWAISRNLRVSTGDPNDRWVSGEIARQLVHTWRAGAGAIIVGAGTVLADNPELTVRISDAFDMQSAPLRVVMDRQLSIPEGSRLVLTASPDMPVLVFTSPESEKSEKALMLDAIAGITVVGCSSILDCLKCLGSLGVRDVLLESGPTLASAFSQAGLLDTISIFRSGKTYGNDLPGFSADSFLAKVVANGKWLPIDGDEYLIL